VGLFELILRFPGRVDARLGGAYKLGSVVWDIEDSRWYVAGGVAPQSWFADGRYMLLPVAAWAVETI
jgi:hypothetical protein